ncbi:MAG: DUF4147 domain-containing protein [Gammaproteobacteria bacterium]
MSSTRIDTGSRDRLVALFRRALAAVRGDSLSEEALRGHDFSHVIALGKAAEALAAGAWRAARGKLQSGFLAMPGGYATGDLPPAAPFERHQGAHPLPDKTSLAAGAALLNYVAALPTDAQVVVLVSGGASAAVEVLAPGVDLAFSRRANRWLIASGLAIADINRVRAGLSQLKGGGLARSLMRIRATAWVLADVSGGGLEWVGGGLLSPTPAGKLPPLPTWLEERLATTPHQDSLRMPLQRLAGNEEAVAAVVAEGAQEAGSLNGDAVERGIEIGAALAAGAPGLYVWGGEPTVRLPENPGQGGRCQQLALAAATVIAGRDDCYLLAGGTDGWDGSAAIAGACVDGDTLERGRAQGLDPRRALAAADAGRFLDASGDLLRTGPTGTNVNDLVIALKR